MEALQEPPAAHGEDEDPYRRAMSIRKSRAKQFFSNEWALFTLLLVLVYHHFLGRVTKIAFRLRDTDKPIPDDPEGEPAYKRKRLLFKGYQAFQEVEPRKCRVPDIFSTSLDCVNIFWKILTSTVAFNGSVFGLLPHFWPRSSSFEDLYDRLVGDTLKTICGLKWRVMSRERVAPYSLLEMVQNDPPPELLQAQTKKFMSLPLCCQDPFWVKPVIEDLSQLPGLEEQIEKLQSHIQSFQKTGRVVSAREENCHATQRLAAGCWRAKPTLFEKQSAQMVLTDSYQNHRSRTKTQLGGAPLAVKQASKSLRARKVVHKRPRQFGSAMFHYMSAERKAGSQASEPQLRQQWKNLTAPQRETWITKHRLNVASRRFAKSFVQQREGTDTSDAVKASPWNLGVGEYPLKPEFLANYLQPFQRKATGLEQLGRVKTPQAIRLKEKYENGRARYHSMTAAECSARSLFCEDVDDSNAHSGTWGKAAACSRPQKTCDQLHIGVCRTRDEALFSDIFTLVERLPKKDNAILMLELSGRPAQQRVVTFVRMIIGLGIGGGMCPCKGKVKHVCFLLGAEQFRQSVQYVICII